MPRAIAPEVTTTTSTPARCSAATSSQIRATTDSRSSPVVLGDDRRAELDDGDGHGVRSLDRRAGVELERRSRAISTSSPGSKPFASSAAITPMRRSRCSTCASASSFSRSWRAISRSTASPATRNSPAPVLLDLERAPRGRAGRPGTRPPRSRRPRRRRTRGSATGTRRSSSRAELVEPLPRRARGHQHRHVDALAPLRGGRLGLLGRDEVGLGEREHARERGQPRVVLGQLGLDHAVVLDRVRAVERREVEHVHEQPRALDVGEEVVAEPGAVARALDQPRDVGDHELAVVGVERAEHRLERRERVGGDLRAARASAAPAARTCPRWAARRARRRRAA